MAGIYISFPFCLQKCTYCHFSSGVFPSDWMPAYLEALETEIRTAHFPSEPDTLYLGGGTPSLIEIDRLDTLLSALPARDWREATIEASPGTVTEERVHAWKELGINRASLGVQSFIPREVAATGRKHTPETVATEMALLARVGIDDVNIDLLAGLAHQTPAGWQESLDWIAKLSPSHVSVYMLDVDDDSRLGRELQSGGSRFGAASVPSDDQITEFYTTAIEMLKQHALRQYEISNFARAGQESIHNRKYWRMEPYIGFGADAHSFDGRRRWGNVASVKEYLDRSQRGESVRKMTETLDERRIAEDRFITGLRQIAGFDAPPSEMVLFQEPLRRLIERGWLRRENGNRLSLTPEGLLFSNEAYAEFLAAK
ncbi:MAG: radical SAM family heme chaperone HemW [Bryobacterales bacterium]|nr:radical SAM family heme chaperone HemW [Bryobacterales bacterium]